MRQQLMENRPGASPPDEAPAVDLRRYWDIVRKRFWIIAAVVAVGIASAVIYTERKDEIFRATASVVIDPTPPQVFGNQVQEVIQLGAGSYWSNQEYYNTQLQVITKYDLLHTTVRKNPRLTARLLELPDAALELTPEQENAAADLLAASIGASQNRESRIINLHVQHNDPELAMNLANAHVRTFYIYSKGIRGEDVRDIKQFIDVELANAAEQLRASEQRLLQFKEDNDLLSVSLEDKQSLLAADISEYNAALRQARIERIKLGALRKRAQGLEGEDVMESPIFALASNSDVVDALKQQYMREKQHLAELSQELGPRHPEYQSQKKKTDQQLAAIAAEARRAMRELDERFAAATTSERNFETEVSRLKEEAFELAPKTVEYSRLEREQQSAEENYKLLLGRQRASELTEKNRATNVSVHTLARDAVLVYPRLTINLAVAGLLSLVIGLGLAFLLDLMDRTIKSSEDIERVTGAPLLGTIPVVEHDDINAEDTDLARRARDLYVFNQPNSNVAEHCRSIRTNILFSSANRPMKTLTISSPQQSEGKTTTAIYMGTIMAQSNQRVLLLDTDMRRPRLHKSLLGDRTFKRGLSHLLLPDTVVDDELDSVIQRTEIDNLDILPCGQMPPNPAELLLTERFKEVLAKLEDRYDRILLDSPPLVRVNDAVVLSRLSDGVVMVAQAGKTQVDDIRRSARMVRDVDAPILGVILNNVKPSSRGGYYYYYYYKSDYGSPGGDTPGTEAEKAA